MGASRSSRRRRQLDRARREHARGHNVMVVDTPEDGTIVLSSPAGEALPCFTYWPGRSERYSVETDGDELVIQPAVDDPG